MISYTTNTDFMTELNILKALSVEELWNCCNIDWIMNSVTM